MYPQKTFYSTQPANPENYGGCMQECAGKQAACDARCQGETNCSSMCGNDAQFCEQYCYMYNSKPCEPLQK